MAAVITLACSRNLRSAPVDVEVDGQLGDPRRPIERLALDRQEREVSAVELGAVALLYQLQAVVRDREREIEHVSGIDDLQPASGDLDVLRNLLTCRFRPVRWRASTVPRTRAMAGVICASACRPSTRCARARPGAPIARR